jgi:hypothetical protein
MACQVIYFIFDTQVLFASVLLYSQVVKQRWYLSIPFSLYSDKECTGHVTDRQFTTDTKAINGLYEK